MKKTGWIKRALCLLLLVCFAAGGAAEGWPDESMKDGEGKTIKTVPVGDGKTEVWEFIGIFGSEKEALQVVGLKEENEEKPGENMVEIAGKKIRAKRKKKKKEEIPFRLSKRQRRIVKKGKAANRRRKNRLTDVVVYTPPERPLIYIQENRASGR